ncbi:MAG: PRC-barrel domain-containing protein [Candidatus Thermoplasmatota archaeon]|nr:PRC-barrel domain-containing protein [Candidatus Thermoplasmatota archaeon]
MIEKETKTTAEEVTSFLKLPVYTREGTYVGHVRNIFIDMDEKRVSSLLVTNTNPVLVEGTVDVAVPYRWVNAVGDIIILSHFPERVTTKKKEEKTEENTSDADIDVIQ